ncbi:MAG: ATP-grasp domain-containing protein [Lachnospiraceae bacterium]|nr:ATP-grasp domain-containing protein [Lachnospiraceae bacterium]
MRRILVTAISGDIANGILKILQETEDEVYGCDIYDYPVGMDRVIAYWKSYAAVSSAYIENLLKKCKEYQITHLIPANEAEIEVISKNLGLFQEAGIKVMINDPNMIVTFQDKYETIRMLNKIGGIATPRTYLYDDFTEDGQAYIVKLRNSCGSKLLKKIRTIDEITELQVDARDIVIQEYIDEDAREYTVGVFSDGRNTSTIIFRRKLKHGYTSFVELVEDEGICDIAERIVNYMNLRGYINIQLRKHGEKNYIFEINARISGSVYFQYMLGHNIVIWWLDLLDGKLGHVYENKYKKAIGIRELTEKFVIME